MAGSPWLWAVFLAGVFLLLAIEYGASTRKTHAMRLSEAALWSGLWIAASLLFNLILWRAYGGGAALDFFTGYLIEKSLSLDNLFVFVLIFRYFGVERRLQPRVLFWGVFGALAMRAILIGSGVALLRHFTWMYELLGAFLLYASISMLVRGAPAVKPERNPLLRWARKVMPVTAGYRGPHFLVREEGGLRATPLLLVLLAIEAADLLFAVDSIPAVLGITRDPFVVFSSNICAVLGLRALYFLVAGALPRLRYIGAGLSLVLLFIAAKMLVARWLHVSTVVSLALIGAILAITVAASLMSSRDKNGGELQK